MSLRDYLEANQIDQIEDDQQFQEAEYTAIQTYCENCGYILNPDDLIIIKNRGLEDSFQFWKRIYVEDLWNEFEDVPINPETEVIEKPWKHFIPNTHREDIWHWFEKQFDISIAELMGQ